MAHSLQYFFFSSSSSIYYYNSTLHHIVAGDTARGQRPFLRQRHAVPGAAPGPQTGGSGRVLRQRVHGGPVADGRLVPGTVHPGRRAAWLVAGTCFGRPAAATAHQLTGLLHSALVHEGKRRSKSTPEQQLFLCSLIEKTKS